VRSGPFPDALDLDASRPGRGRQAHAGRAVAITRCVMTRGNPAVAVARESAWP
jgi:hypothetical protein